MLSGTRSEGYARNGRAGVGQRRRPVRQSGSWIGAGIGAIKSIVGAPLTWFGGAPEPEPEPDVEPDAQGKRRMAVQGGRDEGEEEHRSKRKRAHSPEQDGGMDNVVRSDSGGYNDPPGRMFRSQPLASRHARHASSNSYGVPRTMPLDPRSSFASSPASRAGSLAPSEADSGKEFPRTNFTLGVNRDAIRREQSVPLGPFIGRPDASRVRPSRLTLTPQPSAFDFGAPPPRELSEHPTLVDLSLTSPRKRRSEEPLHDDRMRSMSIQPHTSLDTIPDERMVSRCFVPSSIRHLIIWYRPLAHLRDAKLR
jgi:hypothetical protein